MPRGEGAPDGRHEPEERFEGRAQFKASGRSREPSLFLTGRADRSTPRPFPLGLPSITSISVLLIGSQPPLPYSTVC